MNACTYMHILATYLFIQPHRKISGIILLIVTNCSFKGNNLVGVGGDNNRYVPLYVPSHLFDPLTVT